MLLQKIILTFAFISSAVVVIFVLYIQHRATIQGDLSNQTDSTKKGLNKTQFILLSTGIAAMEITAIVFVWLFLEL